MAFLPHEKELAYYALIRKIESGGNDRAKNPLSTASGRYQPIKSTWLSFGFKWSDVFDVSKQEQFIRLFTRANAAALHERGCAINFATLYGAHFLGASGLLGVMYGLPGASINTVTSAAQRKANPTILKGTIADFCNWLEKKTGDSVYRRYDVAGGTIIEAPVKPNPKGQSSMNWFNQLVSKTTLQYLLVAIGGYATASGKLDVSQWETISGALVVIAGAFFGIKNAATEKVMVGGTVAKIAELTPATQNAIAKEVAAK